MLWWLFLPISMTLRDRLAKNSVFNNPEPFIKYITWVWYSDFAVHINNMNNFVLLCQHLIGVDVSFNFDFIPLVIWTLCTNLINKLIYQNIFTLSIFIVTLNIDLLLNHNLCYLWLAWLVFSGLLFPNIQFPVMMISVCTSVKITGVWNEMVFALEKMVFVSNRGD